MPIDEKNEKMLNSAPYGQRKRHQKLEITNDKITRDKTTFIVIGEGSKKKFIILISEIVLYGDRINIAISITGMPIKTTNNKNANNRYFGTFRKYVSFLGNSSCFGKIYSRNL